MRVFSGSARSSWASSPWDSGGGLVWVLETKPEPGLVDFWPVLPGVVCFFLTRILWELKDRGGLECEARREGEDLVLAYPAPGEKRA